ncbi:MAG: ATP phosphoribosyltransferase regulatory subunit [Desulfitobacteriaceae bacterium]|nr:ATP phosphoribosyltransferase regulatory subunit [Desulfitobacteriaceae bacterium]MDD4346420.1 ATP phosphoribosyltransferase regulatory subunit [Desulfitobacteriaceae bacterium]MDD4400828.1 ATP phosphoribosyltransferase regulatory subunit [Desulfitobacteriaceae bacterium]
MQRSYLGLRIPEGMHDLLPEELALQERLERNVLDLFRRWSYQKVLTTTLEFGACVQPNSDVEDQIYKFFDRKGHILALRPELTTPIARLVSTRMRGQELPLRLCYSADVFRNSLVRNREFRQAGVELVGSNAGLADAEIIALAVETIKSLGVKDFQINLGHMGIFLGLMKEAGISEELQAKLEDFLARKDMVGVEILVRQSNLAPDFQQILLRLPHLNGREEILDEVLSWSRSQDIREAVEGLRQVYRYLADFGVQKYIALDLGILRGFSYYTGVIFEGYLPGVGFPVIEGGRYDLLYADFGYPLAATGFALHLGSILGQFPLTSLENADVFVYGRDPQAVINKSQEFRSQGKRVEMSLGELSKEAIQELAAKKKIPVLCKV